MQKCAADSKVILLAILIAVISSLLPYIFYTIGLNNMEASVAAVLVAVEPLVGCVIGITVFHDGASPSQIIGIALILGSIVFLNIRRKNNAN